MPVITDPDMVRAVLAAICRDFVEANNETQSEYLFKAPDVPLPPGKMIRVTIEKMDAGVFCDPDTEEIHHY